MNTIPHMTAEQREENRAYAEDMFWSFCEICGEVSMPLPGFVNMGHQCGKDGTTSEYEMPPHNG